jgi:hypothetical protein
MGSVTMGMMRKNGGMPEWAFMRTYFSNKWKGDNQKRFLSRFIFFRTPYLSMDITRIHGDDNDREYPHDHSRSFISFKLIGKYNEWVYYNPDDLSERRYRKHRWLSCHLMRHNMAHTITHVTPYLVTVLLLGPRKHGSNYWTDEGMQTSGMAVDQEQDSWQ